MNRRLIGRTLRRKMNDLIDSIDDEKVKESVRENAFITGGSIVSLLENEPVKDFDIYLRTRESALLVTQYYVDKFKSKLRVMSNSKPKTSFADVSVFSDDISGQIKINLNKRGFASLSDEDVSDITGEQTDVPSGYVQSVLGGDLVAIDGAKKEDPANPDEKYVPIFLSDNAITLSDKIQIVIRFFGEPDEVHKNYDFVHCTNYWKSWDGELVLNPLALESILTKNLMYQGSLYPICSIIRTRKFIQRGWYINAGQFLKMSAQISNLDLSDIDVLREQLTGVDALYFSQIIEECQKQISENPGFSITSGYLSEVLDKIFG